MVFRFVALVLIVLGLMLLGADVISMLERGQEPHLRSLEEVWGLFSDTAVGGFKTWIGQSLPSPLPDGVSAILGIPAFAAFGVIGVALAYLFRERLEAGE